MGFSPKSILPQRYTHEKADIDGVRICKKAAIIFNNDGKAAFDWMIQSVGAIALRRLGASENSVFPLLKRWKT